MKAWLLTLAALLGSSLGQVMFKLSAMQYDGSAGLVRHLAFNLHWWLAMGLYAGASVAWMLALRELPLRQAYPVMALAFVIVPLLAHWLVGETLRWPTLAGAALIVAGVWVSVALE